MLQSIKSIPLTFYSRSFYANLVHTWTGIGIGFIILQVLLSYAAPMLMQLPALPEAQESIKDFFDQMPDIAIANQKLSIDRPSPYIIDMVPGEDSPKIMFDTNYEGSDLAALTRDMEAKKVGILLTADFAAVRKGKQNSRIEIYDYSQFSKEDLTIKHDEWLTFGDMAAGFFPYLFVLAVIPIFLALLVWTFFKGLAVKVLALFFTSKPELAGAMRIGVAASIPVSVLGFVLAVAGALAQGEPIAVPGFVSLLIWLAFVLFGLSAANKAASKST